MTDTPNKRPAFEPATALLKPTGFDPAMKRPASTVAGAALVLLRVAAGLVLIVTIVLGWSGYVRDLDVTLEDSLDGATAAQLADQVLLVGVIVLGVFFLFEAVLALRSCAVTTGREW